MFPVLWYKKNDWNLNTKRYTCPHKHHIDISAHGRDGGGSAVLTYTGRGQHAGGHVRREAVGKDGLQDIVGEGEGDDSQGGGVHDEYCTPQQEEPGKVKGQMVITHHLIFMMASVRAVLQGTLMDHVWKSQVILHLYQMNHVNHKNGAIWHVGTELHRYLKLINTHQYSY